MERWQVIVDGDSLEAAFKVLAEANVLKLRSEAQQKYDAAAQGCTQAQQDILDAFLKRVHLVHDPADDRTFENCTAFYQAMRGREFTHDNLAWVLQYIRGKGARLHWEDRPSQVQHRAHIPTSPEDYRWAPKSDSNHTPLSRHSHSNDPRFNGENDRKKIQRPGAVEEDVMAATNRVWMMQARALQGQTHSETKRIQAVVSQTPGGGRAAYEAGVREQKLIERERARGR